MDKEKIGMRLTELRGEKTQVEIAKEINVGQSTYAMYETGKRTPSDAVKVRIANYYKKTVQEIFFAPDITNSEFV